MEYALLVTEIVFHLLFFSMKDIPEETPRQLTFSPARLNDNGDRGMILEHAVEKALDNVQTGVEKGGKGKSCKRATGKVSKNRVSHIENDNETTPLLCEPDTDENVHVSNIEPTDQQLDVRINGKLIKLSNIGLGRIINIIQEEPVIDELDQEQTKPWQHTVDDIRAETDASFVSSGALVVSGLLSRLLAISMIALAMAVHRPSSVQPSATPSSTTFTTSLTQTSDAPVDFSELEIYQITRTIFYTCLVLACLTAFWACEAFPTKYSTTKEQSILGLEAVMILTLLGCNMDTLFFPVCRYSLQSPWWNPVQ